MGVGVMHACRGGARSTQIVSLHCDEPGACRAAAYADSREQLVELRALGWSVDFAAKTARCPAHSGVAPTVDVQQALL